MILRTSAVCMAVAFVISGQVIAKPKPEFTVRVLSITTTTGTQVVSTPQRTLSFTLTSPEKALPNAIAELYFPETLKLGIKADLAIDPPVKKASPDSLPINVESLRMNIYWGSSETIKPGQPKMLGWKDFPQDVKNAMKSAAEPVKGSVAVWTADSSRLDPNAPIVGEYRLMSFVGACRVFLDSAQDFLSSVEISVNEGVKGVGPIQISWKPVPGALAYFVTAHGVKTDGTISGWTSGESPDSAKQASVESFLSAKQRAGLIKKRVLLAPETTNCVIPAGVFDGADVMMINVTAYGADIETPNKQIAARTVIRSIGSNVRLMQKDTGQASEKTPTPASSQP